MIALWLIGLVRRRTGRLLAQAGGVAVAVALLSTLGAFLANSQATMTDRAVRGVAVDWQAQLAAGTDVTTIARTMATTAGVTRSDVVAFGQSTGLSATTGGTSQTTGAAIILGLPASYRTDFPAELRTLTGSGTGVLLAQQTAANLHAAPGDTISIGLAGRPATTVTVDGIVDLPYADSLFQTVGAPVGASPSAPPDNVLLVPDALWHSMFDPMVSSRPELITTQIHVQLDHRLPADPASAYTAMVAAAHHLEAATVGNVVVGNNLAAALDAARSDAAYAQVLFLFLGVPGAVLAALLTGTVAASGGTRRRAEQALLRTRGATAGQLTRMAATEAVAAGLLGVLLGWAVAAAVGQIAFGTVGFGTSLTISLGWAAATGAVGLGIALLTVLLPTRRDLRQATVAAGRASLPVLRYPAWARWGLDLVLLTVAGILFAVTNRSGYQLVLAPEGSPTIAVSYWALAGPALFWIGAGLLSWRLTDLLLGRGRAVVRRILRPLTGGLTAVTAAGISRQRRPLTRAVVTLALAITFAASTAIFNATYAQQAEADAQLTNGADVTITEPPGTPTSTTRLTDIAAVVGVRAVEPVQHRFAYIGADLQDLYGVRPATITQATALQDSYFSGGSAATLMATLAAQPDAILVSAETVVDYRLQTGDTINLRLLDSRSHQQIAVPFHYVGVVSEFPTAPKDSFFVANAAYIAASTGSDEAGTFLVNTAAQNMASVSAELRALLGPGPAITDITNTRAVIASSLTAVDLNGLTRVELAFGLVLAVAAGALVLGLGLAERRRTFAIATALGAKFRQLRQMIAGEALMLAILGLAGGAAAGWTLSVMLVKVLTGVFDPPPASIAVPWPYLLVLAVASVAGLASVTLIAARVARRPAVEILREL